MRTFAEDVVGNLQEAARSRERLRLNLNVHPRLDDPVQRLFNAMEPGTYVRPHRHAPDRWELFLILRGRAAVLEMDDHGTVTGRCDLAPAGASVAVEIPGGSWHTVVALDGGTLLFEVKPGPYAPLTDKDFAPWAPPEGAPGAAAFEVWLRRARVGDSQPSV